MAKKNKFDGINSGANFGLDPEAVDFTQDTWMWKGDMPTYSIQSDGFTYDIIDEDGIERKAISLGLLGMIIIVYNAKSAKIKEEEVQPAFQDIIKTKNWLSLSGKESNQLGKAAILKLTDPEVSGDVFELASYAPLEIKRILLKKLFKIARNVLKPEFRVEAERRIIKDIVPLIFANPDLELALLTGLIVKKKEDPKMEIPVVTSAQVPVEEVFETEEILEIEPMQDIVEIPARDAEQALQEHLGALSQSVPNISVPKETVEAKEEYIPFSDMDQIPAPSPHISEPAAPHPIQNPPIPPQHIPVPPFIPQPNFGQQPIQQPPHSVPQSYHQPIPPVSMPPHVQQPMPPFIPQPNFVQPPVSQPNVYSRPQTYQPPNVPPVMPQPPAIEHTQPKKRT